LCGYTGSNGILLVTSRDAYFITDGRYSNQAKEQVRDAKVFTYSNGKSVADAFIRELQNNKEIKFRGRVGIETQFMTIEFYQILGHTFSNSPLIETELVIEELAMVKEDNEIECIRKAVEITDKVFETVLPMVKPGVRELDLAAEVGYHHQKFGAQKNGFETIVASGPRSALPHGIASSRKIKKGDFVTFDMGCMFEGYASDMTRTVVVGKATKKQKKIYDVIFEAQAKAIEMVTPGNICSSADAVARKIISDAGYGSNFTHGLGHGLGLEVHARPVLNKTCKTRLKPGMVVTVEPGIYIDGYGGVRIEDDVLVTKDGNEVLNRSPKHLIEL